VKKAPFRAERRSDLQVERAVSEDLHARLLPAVGADISRSPATQFLTALHSVPSTMSEYVVTPSQDVQSLTFSAVDMAPRPHSTHCRLLLVVGCTDTCQPATHVFTALQLVLPVCGW